MKKDEIRQLKARAQRLESIISQLDDEAQLLNQNSVDVTNSTSVSQQQKQVQDELEQVISDLLLLLDKSGSIETDEFEIELPNTGRHPVSDGKLPEPSFNRPEDRGSPLWSNENGN